MIKWLSAASRLKNAEPTPLTNDPLAVIAGANEPDGKGQIYAVTRVNPLFTEKNEETGVDRMSPRKSVSSGYESRGNSSSESSSCNECERKKSAVTSKKRLTKKRSADHEEGTPSTKRRSKKYKNGHLTTIPEGRIDCSIPAPIWPRFDVGTDHDGTTSPLNFVYKYNEKFPKCCTGRSRSLWNYFDEKGHLSGAVSVKTEYEHNWLECCRKSEDGCQITQEVLRDLANLVSYAMKRKDMLTVEEILITLSESIQKSLDMLKSREETYSSGSEGKFSLDKPNSDSDTSLIHHQRDCSSSSTESGFGFSDSSPSDSSSVTLNPVFLYDSVYPKSVRNAILCDTRSRKPATRDCGSSAFVKLISAKRKTSAVDEVGPLTLHEEVKVDGSVLKKVEHPYYIAVGRPDFTLDLPQAEKLVKTLSSSKRRRCWCRLTTSLLGLVFFLFSVMMVSLIVTKGKRLFGAL